MPCRTSVAGVGRFSRAWKFSPIRSTRWMSGAPWRRQFRLLLPERIFLLPWLDIFGRQQKVEPFFVVARDDAGAPLALLPLGLFRFGPLRVAQFLGGKHSNYNLGLFRADAAFSARDLRRCCARRRGRNERPASLSPAEPAADLARRRQSADAAAASPGREPRLCDHVGGDGEAFLAARLSADTRKKLRKKEKRLAGAWARCAISAPQTRRRRRRLSTPYFAPETSDARPSRRRADLAATTRHSIGAGALAQGPPALELHALALDGQMIATFARAGSMAGGCKACSFPIDPDPDIAKSSPGDLLLSHVLRDACARNLSAFDLGPGDARYKTTFCDEIEAMADALFAADLAGPGRRLFFFARSRPKPRSSATRACGAGRDPAPSTASINRGDRRESAACAIDRRGEAL